MSTKIYVGNLPWRTTDIQLSELFAAYGDVLSVRIISDRDTGRSRGFAFVTMASQTAAQAAIAALHGSLLEGRTLVVNEANNQGGRPGSRPAGSRMGNSD
ncbi:MAG: RNA-binding protein [Lautropia sp.]|nr:RNA-binding protein [Lautropia sp.]